LDEYTKKVNRNFESPIRPIGAYHEMTRIKKYLEVHPLFDIMKGMPLAISILAS
jgi:hypothetical protein